MPSLAPMSQAQAALRAAGYVRTGGPDPQEVQQNIHECLKSLADAGMSYELLSIFRYRIVH